MGKIADFFKKTFKFYKNQAEINKPLRFATKDSKDSYTILNKNTLLVPGWVNINLKEKLSKNGTQFSCEHSEEGVNFVFKNKKDIAYAVSLVPQIEKEIEDRYYTNVFPKIVEIPKEMRSDIQRVLCGPNHTSFSLWDNIDDINKIDLCLESEEDADCFRILMKENRLDELRDGRVLLPSVEKRKDDIQQRASVSRNKPPQRFHFKHDTEAPSLDSVIAKCSSIAAKHEDKYKPLQPQRNGSFQL